MLLVLFNSHNNLSSISHLIIHQRPNFVFELHKSSKRISRLFIHQRTNLAIELHRNSKAIHAPLPLERGWG